MNTSSRVQLIYQACSLLLVTSLITGLLYPLALTGIAQWLFPWRSNGSIMLYQNHPIGSQWIGQSFSDDKYFWGRPSMTTPFAYNPLTSVGSNAAPSNTEYFSIVQNRIARFQPYGTPIPVDLVSASASGLDPDISLGAAYYQVSRIAQVRGISAATLLDIIHAHALGRCLGFIGEPRVNVLSLNLALDGVSYVTRAQ